jgi:C4-dicarboxylate-specific signal transduction histidine kinase
VSSSQLALERINQNLALKQNQQARTRLELEQTLNSLQSQMEIKRLELETHSAQVSQTQRLFQDGLASMAMQGGGKLTIRTGIRNDRKYLSIEDTGCGMSAEVQANLFVPFFSTKANGQGIGLTLVQEILSHHRFDFALESKPGGPTLFNIFFTF